MKLPNFVKGIVKDLKKIKVFHSGSKVEDEKVPCFHSLRDRVVTHRGYHCGRCGKIF